MIVQGVGRAATRTSCFVVLLAAATIVVRPGTAVASAAGGSPVTLLFNDRHVYAPPVRNRRGRELGALVRNGSVLVPLRSVFEAMGASVAFDPAQKAVRVTKPGAMLRLVVGKPEVVFNGETRPLDVPPEMHEGTLLVPLRVLSEGLGAFVRWLPERNTVVIRYVAASAPPTVAPTVSPPVVAPSPVSATAAPSAAPVAKASPPSREHFFAGDFLFSPKVYNEFSPGSTAHGSFGFRGGAEFAAGGIPLLVDGAFAQRSYFHRGDPRFDRAGNAPPFDGLAGPVCSFPEPGGAGGDQGCVTAIGRGGASFVPSFTARERTIDANVGVKIADPRIYVGLGYTRHTTNYGYPTLSGIGFGAKKLPDLDQRASVYGSIFYFPSLGGRYANGAGSGSLSYRLVRYQVGGTLGIGSTPSFVDFGYQGDRSTAGQNAPADRTQAGPYVGLGLHF